MGHPSVAAKVIEALGGGCCLVIIACFILRSTPRTWKDWQRTPPVRLAALGTYWACGIFVTWLCVSLFAVKPDRTHHLCRILFFGDTSMQLLAKPFVFYFYVERVLLSYHLSDEEKRKIRIFSVFGMLLTDIAFLVTLAKTPHASLDTNGNCTLGVSDAIAIVSVLVDGGMEIALTGVFIWPVLHAKFEAARALALKSALACVTNLMSTVAMFSVVIVLRNNMLNVWIYNGCWAILFTLNAGVVYAITNPRNRDSLPPLDSDAHLETKESDCAIPDG